MPAPCQAQKPCAVPWSPASFSSFHHPSPAPKSMPLLGPRGPSPGFLHHGSRIPSMFLNVCLPTQLTFCCSLPVIAW